MERSVGQKNAQAVVARRHAGREPGLRAPSHQNDRTAGALKQSSIRLRDLAQPLGRRKILHHDREGFPAAALTLAQQAYRAIVSRSAGEMEASQALDGDNRAPREQPARFLQNISASVTGAEAWNNARCQRLR